MQNGNRKGIAQWAKTYAGKKFYTSILFLALPIILLVTFTFIPALDMVIFSFQNRDPYGTNPTYAGFSNYVTIFTDKDYLETFKNSLYYLVGSFIQQALALLLAAISAGNDVWALSDSRKKDTRPVKSPQFFSGNANKLLDFNIVADPVVGYFYKTYLLGVPQDLAKALAKIGAITTTVNAIIAVIVASILYIALRPVMKKTELLRDL